LVAAAGGLDDLLSTVATAELLGLSVQWLETQRSRGGGPPFVRLSPKAIRYRRGDLITWLAERTHAATSEYRRRAR
jgi:predicted DNA-binding transcriptional regulator AlpA